MPFLDQIVCSINQAIIQVTPASEADIKAYGIAEQMIYADIDAEERPIVKKYPAVIDSHGEATMIEPDDRYKTIIYHKLENVVNTLVKGGYGDNRFDPVETANLSLFVFSFRDKVNLRAHELESLVKMNVRDQLKIVSNGSLLQVSSILFSNSSFDKLALLQREYSEVQLNYPNVIFLEMRYKIESRYNKSCFSVCSSGLPVTIN